MSSVPHRDFLYTAASSSNNLPVEGSSSMGVPSEQGLLYYPLSTPFSRELSFKLKQSQLVEVSSKCNVKIVSVRNLNLGHPLSPHSLCPQNKRLYRASSIADVCDGLLQVTKFPSVDNSYQRYYSLSPIHSFYRCKDHGRMTSTGWTLHYPWNTLNLTTYSGTKHYLAICARCE